MATTSGHEGIVKNENGTIAEVVSFSFSQKTSPVEDTELSDTHKSFKTGGKLETDGSLTCQWDPTDLNGQGIMGVDSEFTLELYPQGDALSGTYWSGNVIVTEIGLENSDGETVKQSFTWISNGPFIPQTVV